jgi:hypothetical protein
VGGTVERVVTNAHSTVSLYDLDEAIDDDTAVSSHQYCGIYNIQLGGNGDGSGVSTSATTSSRALAIVVDRNILRRRCYGPETSALVGKLEPDIWAL